MFGGVEVRARHLAAHDKCRRKKGCAGKEGKDKVSTQRNKREMETCETKAKGIQPFTAPTKVSAERWGWVLQNEKVCMKECLHIAHEVLLLDRHTTSAVTPTVYAKHDHIFWWMRHYILWLQQLEIMGGVWSVLWWTERLRISKYSCYVILQLLYTRSNKTWCLESSPPDRLNECRHNCTSAWRNQQHCGDNTSAMKQRLSFHFTTSSWIYIIEKCVWVGWLRSSFVVIIWCRLLGNGSYSRKHSIPEAGGHEQLYLNGSHDKRLEWIGDEIKRITRRRKR